MDQKNNITNYENDILAIAITAGAPIEQINKIIEMRETSRINEIRQQYLKAFSDFQSECPIIKNKTSVSGESGNYKYAHLGDITQEIKPLLKKNGLSYRWELSLNDQTSNMISCSCIVSHISGFHEETTITAEVDTSGDLRNKIHQRGSTISYLHRLTLKSALGITTADEDADSRIKPQTHGNGKVADLPISEKIPVTLDATKALIPSEDYSKILKDLGKLQTEKDVLDYYFSWEKKYGSSVIFRNMLRRKIGYLPANAKLTKEERDAYKKPEKITEYD